MGPEGGGGPSTADPRYTARLLSKSSGGWRGFLDVQRPYRWNLRRWQLGRCLDVGCGIGRNLDGLPPGSVGVDHNETSVAVCRSRGLTAYTPAEFWADHAGQQFDSMLVAHVLEHVEETTADELLAEYLPLLVSGAKVVLITPQERGFRTDATHIRWVGPIEARLHCERAGLTVDRQYSFPFPRPVGKVFYANEFVTVASVGRA